jgi:hypothetical protein
MPETESLGQFAAAFHAFIDGFEFGEFLGAFIAGAFAVMANATVGFLDDGCSGCRWLTRWQFATAFHAFIDVAECSEFFGVSIGIAGFIVANARIRLLDSRLNGFLFVRGHGGARPNQQACNEPCAPNGVCHEESPGCVDEV